MKLTGIRKAAERYAKNRDNQTPGVKWDKNGDIDNIFEEMKKVGVKPLSASSGFAMGKMPNFDKTGKCLYVNIGTDGEGVDILADTSITNFFKRLDDKRRRAKL